MKKLLLLVLAAFFVISQVSALSNTQLLWEGDTSDHKTITFGDRLSFTADITSYDPPIIVLMTLQDENGNIKHVYLDEAQYTHPGFGFSSYSQVFDVTPDQYANYGDYKIELKTVDQAEDRATRTLTFTVMPPTAELQVTSSANPLSGESPLEVGFGCVATGGYPEYVYTWDFGDGNSEQTQMANHVYNEVGNFTATCIVTDQYGNNGSDSVTIEVKEPIIPNDFPIADFSINPNPSLIGTELTLDASNSYDPDLDSLTYEWDIGNDGDIEFTGMIVHKTFFQAKNYPIRLIVSDGEHESSVIKYAIVQEYYKDFSINADVSPDEGYAPLNVMGVCTYETFGEGLEGTYKIVWNMGDGTTLYGENITHTFENPGNYTATCKVEQEETGMIKQDSEIIQILEESIMFEDFDVSLELLPVNGPAPLGVVGTCEAISKEDGVPANYEYFWNMGDGTTYNTKDIEHTYEQAGNYSPECRVTQAETGIEKSNTTTVEVMGEETTYEDFTLVYMIYPESGDAPLDVVGKCFAIGNLNGLQGTYVSTMDFGDGTIIYDETSYEHTYVETGNYSFACSITQLETGKTKVAGKDVVVTAPEENLPPTAILEGPSSTYLGEIARYDGSASYDAEGSALTYVWYLNGDVVKEGNESYLEVSYEKTGEYSIVLEVIDDKGASNTASINTLVKNMIIIPEDEHKKDFDFSFKDINVFGYDVDRVRAGETLYVTVAVRADKTKGRPSLIIPELGLKSTGQLNNLNGRETMTMSIWIPPNIPPGNYMLRIGFKSEDVRKGEIRWFTVG